MKIENKKTILLVEDEAILALSEQLILEKYGYKVIIEHKGADAVETFKTTPGIDLILMDIDLGKGIDGTETAEIILKDSAVPVVFLSSHTEPEIVEKTEKITSYGYVVKGSSETVLDTSIKMAFKLFGAHQKISDNERRFRAIFNSTFQFTGMLSPDGILIEVNQTALDFAGLTLEEVSGKPFWDTRWWAGNEERVSQLKAAVKEAGCGTFVRYEVELQGAGDNRLVIDFSLKPCFDTNGKVIMLIPEGRDISDRKRTEDALRLRESYLSAIIENQPGLLWLKDRGGRFLAVNSKFSDSCCRDNPELLVGKTDLDIWPYELAIQYIADDAKVIKSEKPYMVEEPISDKGHINWFETFKAPIFDKQGKVIGTTGYSRDITNRKKDEDALNKSESKYRIFVEQSADGIFVADLEGNYLDVNPKGCAMLGYSKDELLELNMRDLVREDSLEKLPFHFDLLSDGQEVISERELIRKDGALLPVEISAKKSSDKHLVGFVRDITERKRVEEALRLQSRELVSLNELGKAVNANLGIGQTITSALKSIVNAINPDLAFFFLREGDRLLLKEALPSSAHQSLDAAPEHRVGECMCGLAISTGHALYSFDIFNDPRCTWNECKKAGLNSFAALPVRTEDEIIGVIGIASATERDFEKQSRFLETMTDQVSLAMGNARLYETVKSELAKQKQAEKALRENEKRMQTFLDSTSDMAFLKDRNFRHTIANRALCRFYGRTESEIIGKTDFDLMTESAAAKCRETDEQTLRSNAKIINEEVIGDRHYETMKFPVEFEDGEKGIGAYIRDITERKQTEDTLRTSEERFRKIFDEGQIGIVILNSKFGFEKANPIFCRITGYSPDELMLMTFMDITHKDHIAEDVENVAKLTRGEISCYKTEKRYLRKDDKIVWGKVSVTVVRDKDNNFLYYLVIVDDITERKCAEEKITSLLSEKDFILKEVHHRIKNNMSTIQGLLNLQAGTLKGHSASAALLDAGSRVNSMMVLYDKLYQSSSFNDISIKSYLSSLVDEIVANFPASITVTIEKKIDDIVLDVTKLQPLGIIINELITNIMKYAFTGRDGGLIAIEAVLKPGSKEKENIVSMVVSDNGNGMPESTDFENSTGFGLMLVGMLTRQLKGTVYTERADGTRIILEFPAL